MNYFWRIGVKNILVAPISKTRRAVNNKLDEISVREYIKAFMNILSIAREKNIKISNSCFEYLKSKRIYVCGAMSCKTMTVTTEGNLTACFEVMDEDDPLFNVFNIGRVEKGKGVKIFRKRITILKHRNVENMKTCVDCFGKYFCAGGCGVRNLRTTGNLMEVSEYECKKNKEILKIIFEILWNNSASIKN